MMKAKATHQNKLMKILTMPIKALAKARDFYVKSMNNYADKVHYGAGVPGWGSASYSVPRSFSTTSGRSSHEEDFKELVRAASTSTLGKRIDISSAFSGASNSNSSLQNQKEVQQRQQQQQLQLQGNNNKGIKRVPRSASVGMAKIEEDKPCEFEFGDAEMNGLLGGAKKDEPKVPKDKFRMFPRSRSYALGATKRSSLPSAFN